MDPLVIVGLLILFTAFILAFLLLYSAFRGILRWWEDKLDRKYDLDWRNAAAHRRRYEQSETERRGGSQLG